MDPRVIVVAAIADNSVIGRDGASTRYFSSSPLFLSAAWKKPLLSKAIPQQSCSMFPGSRTSYPPLSSSDRIASLSGRWSLSPFAGPMVLLTQLGK